MKIKPSTIILGIQSRQAAGDKIGAIKYARKRLGLRSRRGKGILRLRGVAHRAGGRCGGHPLGLVLRVL
ncbi:MAG: hypothetical protein ABR988_18455 [Terriglobales bacterium]|jgi:hypothetical protein